MGNSSSKDHQHGARSSVRQPGRPDETDVGSPEHSAPTITVYAQGGNERRGSRHDIPFLHVGRDRNAEAAQRPKETRQEKEARRAERERQARLAERERSMKEESVDGGYLVTLGTYTGPEDFSKPVVRQLQLERRLAPFWKGLNDHSDSWTEYQLVAAVRGLPIPAADEVPVDIVRSPTISLDNNLTVPSSIQTRSDAQSSPATTPLSSSAPLTSVSTSPFFRGRSKTLASLTGGSKTAVDLVPQEIQLSTEPYVNGLPIEAYLYREPGECPICFLYYPPYLNKTRCCDQPICSECFVQIKRPDPHPPEHEQPGEQRRPEEEAELLVSEVAACPFCVAPEFGITYEPPPFRRGLGYANQSSSSAKALSATSSQTSFQSGERRRTISISASAPEVVTTDRVRPDWARKLADARAHVLRRSAAATALHNAAYVLGNQESLFRAGYGRRRRSVFIETAGSGTQTPGDASSGDLFPGRTSSRRNRVEDLEDLMMMEAIRLSLAAEEDRKRKDDKEKAKEDKKKSKEAKKEAKQLEKLSKKQGGSSTSLYKMQSNDSTSTWATNSMARSTSNLGSPPAIPEEVQGKGKAPVLTSRSRSGSGAASIGDAQRHLEESRSMIQPAVSSPIPMPGRRHPRQLSNASSIASSLIESAPDSYHGDSPNGSGVNLHDGTPPTAGSLEPMLNFRSLAAMIDDETKRTDAEHAEDIGASASHTDFLREPSPAESPTASIEGLRKRGDSGESSSAIPIGALVVDSKAAVSSDDKKTGVQVLEHGPYHEATQ